MADSLTGWMYRGDNSHKHEIGKDKKKKEGMSLDLFAVHDAKLSFNSSFQDTQSRKKNVKFQTTHTNKEGRREILLIIFVGAEQTSKPYVPQKSVRV